MWDAVSLPGWPTWEQALISDPAPQTPWEGKPCLVHPLCPVKLSRTTESALRATRAGEHLVSSLASAGPPPL